MSTPLMAPPPPTQPTTTGPRSTTTSGPAVVGDGTTARSRSRSRWRRWRVALLVLVLLATFVGLASLIEPRTSQVPLAPDNTGDDGGRAVAEVLRRQGVEITYVRTTAEALRAADAGTTLLITSTYTLMPEQVDALAEVDSDVVLLEPDWLALSELTDDALDTSYDDSAGPVDAQCDDPDAVAAGSIASGGTGLTAYDARITTCFPHGDPETGLTGTSGAYAVLTEGDRTLRALDDASILSNERVLDHGHAALALRMLGHHDRLTWYVPSFSDTGLTGGGPSTSDLLPARTGPVVGILAAVAVMLMLWRGRSLGRVVPEPLPVTVRAAEVTVGRGRLYRRARARGHAAAALRAGTARRAAARLGLPRSADAPAVIDALAGATGRTTDQVADLLYGPPPTDDAGLVDLTRRLDQLESEVHRT